MAPSAPPLAPTPILRWVEVADPLGYQEPQRTLQQWWAQAVPEHMRDHRVGEWRDVEVFAEES
jgi:hypothetical protein